MCNTLYVYARATATHPAQAAPGQSAPGQSAPGQIRPGPISPRPINPAPISSRTISPGPINPNSISSGPINPGQISPESTSLGALNPGTISRGPIRTLLIFHWCNCTAYTSNTTSPVSPPPAFPTPQEGGRLTLRLPLPSKPN